MMKSANSGFKRILVTGAGGFIGHHLVKRLRREQHWVRGIDIKKPQFEEAHAHEFFLEDLRDPNVASRLFFGMDEVYALAADMGGALHTFSGENDFEIITNNARINTNTALAAKENNVERLLFSSSACVYNQLLQEETEIVPLREEDAFPAYPDSVYGWEKIYGEILYNTLAEHSDCQVRIVRFHNIFGPLGSWNDGREKAPAALCRKIAEAKRDNLPSIEVFGDGLQTRSFCYIDDCINGLIKLMNSDISHPLNLGTDRAVSINELCHIIMEAADYHVDLIHDLTKPQGVRGRNADLTRVKKELGWKPRVSLEEGIKKTYDWIEGMVFSR